MAANPVGEAKQQPRNTGANGPEPDQRDLGLFRGHRFPFKFFRRWAVVVCFANVRFFAERKATICDSD
jgi:hypothetical protein